MGGNQVRISGSNGPQSSTIRGARSSHPGFGRTPPRPDPGDLPQSILDPRAEQTRRNDPHAPNEPHTSSCVTCVAVMVAEVCLQLDSLDGEMGNFAFDLAARSRFDEQHRRNH